MAITSTGSGNWTSTTPNAPWPSGIVPTAADAVTIAGTHTITLDNTTCVALSLTINSGGTLACSTAANSTLTVQNQIDALAGSQVNLDVSSVPSITCAIKLNNAANVTTAASRFQVVTTGSCTIKGAPRTRKTTLVSGISAGATTATVANASGWAIGDKVIFATTGTYNATPLTDEVTLTAANPGTGVISWTGGTTNAHATGGYVGNFSSNMTIGPATAGGWGAWGYNQNFATSGFNTKLIDNVLFLSSGNNDYPYYGAAYVEGTGAGTSATDIKMTFSNNAFYDFRTSGIYYNSVNVPIGNDGNVFYTTTCTAVGGAGWGAAIVVFLGNHCGTINNAGVFRITGPNATNVGVKFDIQTCGSSLTNSFISGTKSQGLALQGAGISVTDCEIFACATGIDYRQGNHTLTRVNNGTFNSGAATNGTDCTHVTLCDTLVQDSKDQTAGAINSGLSTCITAHKLTYLNKNADVTQQEIYRPFMAIKRDNSNTQRSTSSVAIYPTTISTNCQRTVSIPCANGASIRVVGYVKKSHASNIAASVAVSGLGSAWGGFTAAANTNWQQFDTGAITNSSGVDGNFTLTYTANSSSGTANVAYFDGVPDSPFVTKARHYGFTFDEANPNRTVNATVQASESTAAAYTGITIAGGSVSPVTLGASKTFQQVYDYSQAWSCLNLTSAVPCSATGAAGSAAMVALANFTTTGFTLDGSGSLSMGSFTLTANQPCPYTYTGGQFSQASGSGLPVFNGGTLTLSTTGTRTLNMSGGQITFSAAGTYNMASAGLSGSVNLVNTSGSPVTVQLGASASYTNTGPNITVVAPQVYQSVTVNGLLTGSRVQIYDVTSSTELANAVVGATSYTWTDSVAASASRAIRVRIAKVSGATAKGFVEANIGTCGTTSGTESVSYLVNQTDDTVYGTNAIDGSTVTGITITPSPQRVAINIAGGTVSWPQIYAYQVYWLSTATGIADEAAFIAAPDTANYLLTGFDIKNTSTAPLKITNGYGRDAITGLVEDCIDVAGSAGNIYPMPNHAIPYSSGSGLTAGQAAQLAAVPDAVTVASAVWNTTLP